MLGSRLVADLYFLHIKYYVYEFNELVSEDSGGNQIKEEKGMRKRKVAEDERK